MAPMPVRAYADPAGRRDIRDVSRSEHSVTGTRLETRIPMVGTATLPMCSAVAHEPSCSCGQPLETGADHCPRCGIAVHP